MSILYAAWRDFCEAEEDDSRWDFFDSYLEVAERTVKGASRDEAREFLSDMPREAQPFAATPWCDVEDWTIFASLIAERWPDIAAEVAAARMETEFQRYIWVDVVSCCARGAIRLLVDAAEPAAREMAEAWQRLPDEAALAALSFLTTHGTDRREAIELGRHMWREASERGEKFRNSLTTIDLILKARGERSIKD